MMRTFSIPRFALVLLSACSQTSTSDDDVDAFDEGKTRLLCELSYRESNTVGPGETGMEPKFEFKTKRVEIGSEESGSATLGSVTLEATYVDSPEDVPSFAITLRAGDTRLFHNLYQFDRAAPPRNQFVGDHGFTGLVYVASPLDSGDYQYVCKTLEE
jgi:hypothetical protein